MNKWINFKEKMPQKRELCDFLWSDEDGEGDGIWMLCSAKLKDQEHLDRPPDYWRIAEKLPDDVKPWKKKKLKK